jgi:hypothetical protein
LNELQETGFIFTGFAAILSSVFFIFWSDMVSFKPYITQIGRVSLYNPYSQTDVNIALFVGITFLVVSLILLIITMYILKEEKTK